MESGPDFKPTRQSHIHGVLATHLAIKGIQAEGCGGCSLHCATLKNGTCFWRNAPLSEGNRVQKPGHRAHLAVTNAHDDDSDTPNPAMLAINRALNDDLLDHDLRREIAAAAKTHDFRGRHGKLGITVTNPRTLSHKEVFLLIASLQ